MPRTFAITADDKPVALKKDGTGEITVAVTNTSTRPIRGLAKLVPLGAARADWLSINGEPERSFSPNEAHQFAVRLAAPAGTPPGKYSCRLNMMSVQNPDDDFAEGPALNFELSTAGPKPPEPKPMKWLFWVILAVVLLAGGGAAAFFLMKPKLNATFTASKEKGFAPLKVTFASKAEGKPEGLAWNFGDGAMATNMPEIEHTFDKPGAYTVTLLASNNSRQAFSTKEITVLQRASAQFDASPDAGPATLKVSFVNKSIGDDVSYKWEFGNGVSSTAREPAVIPYSNPGTFTARLTVTGPSIDGESNVSTKVATVRVAAPSKADFSVSPVSGEIPLTVRFNDLSAGNPTSWLWSFGDGTTSAERNPSHVYKLARGFNVSLSINGPGGPGTVTKNNAVIPHEAIRTVPAVIGKKLPEAQKLLAAQNLAVGTLTQNKMPLASFGGLVMAQQPAPGTRVHAGDKVNLTVFQ